MLGSGNNTCIIFQFLLRSLSYPGDRRIANAKKGILVFRFNNFSSHFLPKVDSELSQYTSLGSHDLYTTYKTDKIRFLIFNHDAQ